MGKVLLDYLSKYFLQKLLERLNVLNSEMKAVVKYLEADYLWVENEISEEKYRELLEKAISYSDRCVSCYIDLARVYGVTSERGKQLIKVAVTKIDEVYDVNDELKWIFTIRCVIPTIIKVY